MATAVLSIAVAAIPGVNVVGILAATLVGSIIDRLLLFPALFGGGDVTNRTNVVGPRLLDFQLLTNSEGSPMPVLLGVGRVNGMAIYVSDLIEEVIVVVTRTESEGGGKGGGSQTITSETTETSYFYYANCAIAFADTHIGGPVNAVDKIIADGKTLYQRFPDVTLVDDQIAAQKRALHTWQPRQLFTEGEPPFGGQQRIVVYRRTETSRTGFLIADTASGGANLQAEPWVVGNTISVSGFLEATNNAGWAFGSAVFAAGSNPVYRIDLDGPETGSFLINFEGSGTSPIFFPATAAQVETALEAIVGAGNVTVTDDTANPWGQGGYLVEFTNDRGNQPAGVMTIHPIGLRYLHEDERLQQFAAPNPGAFQIEPGVWDGSTVIESPERPVTPERDGAVITLFQDNPSLDPTMADQIAFRSGGIAQAADPQFAAWVGTGVNTPGFTGTAYLVITRLALIHWGNRMPSTFSVIADGQVLGTAKVGIDNVMNRATDLSPFLRWDASACAVAPIRGFNWAGPQIPAKILEQMLTALNLNVRESQGQLIFYPRGQEKIVVIDSGDLGAHTPDSDPPRPIEVGDLGNVDLPSEVEIRFQNVNDDFEPGAQPYVRTNARRIKIDTLSLPISMTPSEAQNLGRLLATRPEQDRQTATLFVPPSYLEVEDGVVVQAQNEQGEGFDVEVLQQQRGNNGIQKVEGIVRDAALLDFDSNTDDDDPDGLPPYIPPQVFLQLMDTPALLPAQTTVPGFYFAGAALNPQAQWRGAAGFFSTDGLEDYERSFTISQEASIGFALTALPNRTPPYWDRASTVDVQIFHGSLSNATARAVLEDGTNWMLIGGEIVGFQNAELLSETVTGKKTYRLSVLVRAIRNTDFHAEYHFPGEACVLLRAGELGFKAIDASRIGAQAFYKAVALGGELDDAQERDITYRGNTLRPFAPVVLKGVRDNADGAVDVSWIYRTRAFTSLFAAAGAVPVEDQPITYRVRFIVDSITKRQVDTVATALEYTPAQQLEDEAEDGFTVAVTQLGAVGEGNIVEIDVPAWAGTLV